MTRKKVLIPLDGSPLSRSILPHVCRLLGAGDHQIILLRVAEPLAGITGAPPRPIALGWTGAMYEHARDIEYARHPIYASQLEQGQSAEFEHELVPARHQLEQHGYHVTTIVRFGLPADEIIDIAEHAAVDFVAMATHGESGLRRMVVGSVAADVLARLHVPILLIRPFPDEAKKRG